MVVLILWGHILVLHIFPLIGVRGIMEERWQNYLRSLIINCVGIALGYGLDDWGSRVRFPAGAGNFSLHHRVQNGSGAHPVSYPMGTRGSFPGGKAARA
jgi:hypothetical protein